MKLRVRRDSFAFLTMAVAILGTLLLVWCVPVISNKTLFHLELKPPTQANSLCIIEAQQSCDLALGQIPAGIAKLQVRIEGNPANNLTVSSGSGMIDVKSVTSSWLVVWLQRGGTGWGALQLKNTGQNPVSINQAVLDDYFAINGKMPRLAILLKQNTGRAYIGALLLILSLCLMALGIWLDSLAGPWTIWSVTSMLAGPLLGLSACAAVRMAGGWLAFYWETMAILLCGGPAVICLFAFWRVAPRSERSTKNTLKLTAIVTAVVALLIMGYWTGQNLALLYLVPITVACAVFWKIASLRGLDFQKAMRLAVVAIGFVAMTLLVYQAEKDRVGGQGAIEFLHLGQNFAVNKAFLPEAFAARVEIGYDGQFFYYMAQDPLAKKGADANIDSPSFRYQRPLYPWLMFLLTGGDKTILPAVMIWFNVLCLGGSFIVLILMLKNLQEDWWKALFFLGNFGLFISAFYGLAEPLSDLLLITSLLLVHKKRYVWCSAIMTLMVLCKEYYVLAPLAVAGSALWERQLKRALLFVIPLFIGALCQYAVYVRFQTPAWAQSRGNFDWFLTGLFGYLLGDGMPDARLLILGIFASIIVAVLLYIKRPVDPMLWIWGAFLVLNLTGGYNRLEHSLLRVFSPAYMAYLAILTRERDKAVIVPGVLMLIYSIYKLNFFP